jgi:diguanylate cyclase (GGDEF)-like protein
MRAFLVRLGRVVVTLAIYCAAFVILDYLSTVYAATPQSSPWYLSAALSFYLVYTFGPRYAPAPILAELVRYLVLPKDPHLTLVPLLGFGVEMMIAYSLTALFLRYVIRARLPFVELRDVFWYAGIGAFLGPAIAGLLGVYIFQVVGIITPAEYWSQVFTFATGDAMGFLTLVPALAIFVTPLVKPELAPPSLPEEARISRVEMGALVVVLFAASVVGYRWLEIRGGAPVYYFLFLPLVWMAARGGLRFATVGIMCADLSVVALDYWFRTPVTGSLAYQSYIAASSLTALTLGAVVTQRWRDFAADLERARIDRVTGLPNPRALDEWLGAYNFGPPIMLLLIAIDNMRWVNEGLHRQGIDEFMKAVGERLRDVHLGDRYLAHTSDAEFAVVLAGDDRSLAAISAEKVRHAFERPVDVGETEIYASVSVGIASCGNHQGVRKLVPHAEQALDEARDRGVESVVFHVPREGDEPLISLAAQLHRAVANDEFDVLYQPIFELPAYPDEHFQNFGATICGAEALLRWNHPTRGQLAPAAFIDLLESMSLAERVGSIVIRKACSELSQWRRNGCTTDIWINGFVRQVLNPEFAGSLRASLMQFDLEPRHVVVELLEHVIARDEGVLLGAVTRLRQTGVRVAIDDFGTGNSSLGRLREVPFDMLKIDRSFVSGIDTDRRSEDVVMTLSSLARDFDVPALAEGVETESQLHFLIRHKYRYAQGYYLGLPMTAVEMGNLLSGASAAT